MPKLETVFKIGKGDVGRFTLEVGDVPVFVKAGRSTVTVSMDPPSGVGRVTLFDPSVRTTTYEDGVLVNAYNGKVIFDQQVPEGHTVLVDRRKFRMAVSNHRGK